MNVRKTGGQEDISSYIAAARRRQAQAKKSRQMALSMGDLREIDKKVCK